MGQSVRPKGKSSIVRGMNVRLCLRLLVIYMLTNFLIFIIFMITMMTWCEERAGEIVATVEQYGLPTVETMAYLDVGEYTVIPGVTVQEDSNKLPDFLPKGEATAEGTRWVTINRGGIFFFLTLRTGEQSAYILEMPYGADAYTVMVDLSTPVKVFVDITRVIVVCQIISLISNLFQNASTLRRGLRPLQDLAATTSNLNRKGGQEELQSLTGTLDAISPRQLGTRISIDQTQQELQPLAEAINAMLDRIAEGYEYQLRFVSDASHELRTPITVIQGYANLLNRWGKDDPATRQEAIEAIQGEADTMKEMVEQLLLLARGDNEVLLPKFVSTDLKQLAEEVYREMSVVDQSHPFVFRGEEAVPVYADVSLLKQSLRILVDNAMKYTPQGGAITLQVETVDAFGVCSVSDQGQGIDPEHLPHIFERFYRADQSRTRQTGGTGLGLSIAKQIVERHGGRIEVESKLGEGSEMTVLLPLHQ